ncbi:hypothetical protein BGZ68_001396 [Mortierella alpina]|nr:hypothetical protein BGZ68_001396 [Mortierella alpina]
MYSFNSDSPLVEDEYPNQLFYNTNDALCNGSSSVTHVHDSSPEDLGYEEAFYDPDDIQLEPRQLHKPKASKPKQRPETKVLLPLLRMSRKHYEFPIEVLELVCSHLSQVTLRCAVSLVCKEWNNVSKRYIQHKGVWENPSMDQESLLLKQMPTLFTLECRKDGPVPHNKRAELTQSWDRFKTAITAPSSDLAKDRKADTNAPNCLLHYIRRLVIKGPYMSYENSIPKLLHRFQFLQSLHLHVESTHIPLFKLLDRSPCLRELKVVGKKCYVTQLLSGDDEDLIPEKPDPIINPETAHFPRKPPFVIPPKAYPHRYRLEVLEIDYVYVKQRVLERVISTCPDIRVFKFHEINDKIWVPELSLYKNYPINEKRIWNHVLNCCPKIEWYHVFLLATQTPNRMTALGRMHLSKTFGRFMTTSCAWNLHNYLPDLEIRGYLRNIIVLEVLPTTNFRAVDESLHSLLCLMPNLLHLITTRLVFRSSSLLALPGNTNTTSTPREQFDSNNRARKRQEREERRQQRQRALERFQGLEHGRLSVPKVWQCRDLRSMVMDFSPTFNHFRAFTQYVGVHRLLRNLTSLSINIDALRVGQLKHRPAPVPQFPKKSGRKLNGRVKIPTTQAIPVMSDKTASSQLLPERWENDFLSLRGLRCLEHLDVKASAIPGLLQATDFEFLRKQNHSHVMLFIADKNKDAGSDEDEDLEKTEKCGRRKDRTFWPRLESFYIKYRIVDVATNFADVVAGTEHIRPGVEFVIRNYD